ncbi:GDP-mannose 4,6-dehydratase [Streptomyces sp. NPDC020858]|uniref:GDP-mannose 4,6-dehydratase n=1 Tax=Streptomyces sp. NPDC020858 TaxID=3365097 RepID=UPI0037BCD242
MNAMVLADGAGTRIPHITHSYVKQLAVMSAPAPMRTHARSAPAHPGRQQHSADSAMNSPRIPVTGGGLSGSHCTRALIQNPDARGTVLKALTYAGRSDNFPPRTGSGGFRLPQGDLHDAARVDRLAAETGQIVHFVARSRVDRCISGGSSFTHINIVGIRTLLEADRRRDVRVFGHFPKDEVYGSIASGATAMTAPLRPSSCAASKEASDLMALAYHRTHRQDVRVTQCGSNYGPPCQHSEKRIPRFVTRLLSGRNTALFRRGWDMIDRVQDREGHDQPYVVDDGKICETPGYQPVRDIATTVEGTQRWYLDHPSWWRVCTEGAGR